MGWSVDNSTSAELAAQEALKQALRAEAGADYIDEKQPLIDTFVDEQTNLQTQLNDLVLQSGTDIAEVVQARGGFATVNERLTNTTALLADTETLLNNRIDGIITTPTTGVSEQEFIDARQGSTSLGANLTKVKNNLLEVGGFSANLINFTLDRVGYYGSNLQFNTTDIGVTTSDFIPVTPGGLVRFYFPLLGGQQYIVTHSDVNNVIIYRAQLTPIANTTFYDVPANTYFITIAYNHNQANVIEARQYLQGKILNYEFAKYDASIKSYIGSTAPSGATSFYSDKKYNALGDSITIGYIGMVEGLATYMSRPYPTVVKDIVGFNLSRNYGISGTCIASGYGARPTEGMVDRYSLMDNDAHVVTVLGGVNDRDNNVPLGTMGSTDKTNFYGALKILVEGLIKKYPSKVICLMTPLQRGADVANTAGFKLSEYAKAIKEIGAFYALPVLDLHATGNFYSAITENSTANSVDGLHPNQTYVENILGRKVAGFIKSVS